VQKKIPRVIFKNNLKRLKLKKSAIPSYMRWHAGPTSGGAYGELILVSLFDFIIFLLDISLYTLAKSEF
jgi:hypothetical protein